MGSADAQARVAARRGLRAELLAAAVALSAALGMAGAPPAQLLLGAGLGWGLLAVALVDLRRLVVPDALSLPLLALGLLAAALDAAGPLPRLRDSALGAALGWLALAGLAELYRRLRGREGLGPGDARLLAAGGAWIGWQGLPGALLLASLLGLLSALLLARARRRRLRVAARVPFAPALALAIWLVWLLGPPLVPGAP